MLTQNWALETFLWDYTTLRFLVVDVTTLGFFVALSYSYIFSSDDFLRFWSTLIIIVLLNNRFNHMIFFYLDTIWIINRIISLRFEFFYFYKLYVCTRDRFSSYLLFLLLIGSLRLNKLCLIRFLDFVICDIVL